MCGLLGFQNKGEKKDLRLYSRLLRHRGPDGIGYFQDDHFSFVHWRLSIIDLSDKAAQPYFFDDLVLLLNGEIYNYKELAVELEKMGYNFSSHSDTEVLIKAFHCWREKAADRLVGMFAFAVYNRKTRETWLFRDRMGVKPMYYSTEGGLMFGSEMKIFKALGQKLTMDPRSLHQYFRFGYSPGEDTIFKEVKKLQPGHYLRYVDGSIDLKSYWDFPAHTNDPATEKELLKQLENVLATSFRYRMVSDVPVGLFLSGGVDSSLVATLLQQSSQQKLKTFTIGFDQADFDETPYARRVAERLGTDHAELRLDVSMARDLFQNFYDIYDEPFGDTSGIPTALVASLARQHGVKVVLSADGADELFGGYNHYRRVAKFHSGIEWVPDSVRDTLAGGLRNVGTLTDTFNLDHKLSALEERLREKDLVRFFESSCSNQTHKEIERLTGFAHNPSPLMEAVESDDPREIMMTWDAKFFLPDDLLLKVDRATMYNSVEGRDPFLDQSIVELARRLPMSMKIDGGTNKVALRKILYRYLPAPWFERPKQGFSIPIFKWFKTELDDLFAQHLTNEAVEQAGLNKQEVQTERRKYEEFKSKGKQYNIEKMWRLLSFMMWFERWMK